jgi:hypothetical protein
MNPDFTIKFRKSCGNLHVYVNGDFNEMCAWSIIKTIKREYNGTGRVFVSTDGFSNLMEAGIKLFKEYMLPQIMPLDRLFLKGKNGFKIGPNGCRVLIYKKQTQKQFSRKSLRIITNSA